MRNRAHDPLAEYLIEATGLGLFMSQRASLARSSTPESPVGAAIGRPLRCGP